MESLRHKSEAGPVPIHPSSGEPACDNRTRNVANPRAGDGDKEKSVVYPL
jgi:hypothetical protein